MGINLGPLLEIRPIKVEELANQKVAIDGYNNYCQLILDKNLKKFEFANSQNFHFTDYNFSNKNLKHILQILEKRRIQKDLEFKKKLLNKKKNIDKFIELY